ncbi:MAG TPA: RNase P subunit [Nitrososphaera sp.]|nr:RNase P subunit [Nitrososphaera sp.]
MKKKENLKGLARERVDILVRNALREKEGEIAANQALLARKIAMRYRLRLPYDIKQLFCKSCKQFVVPGRTARVRLGRSNAKAVRITCLMCGHVYRKVLPAE